jgi:hypothetical protein
MNDNNVQWYPVPQFNIKLKSGEMRLHRLMNPEANLFLELSQKYDANRAFRVVAPWHPDAIESFEFKIEFHKVPKR